mgnify:CR=1 FL=1
MKLNSELDVLLATARELLQAEDDANQQTLQLHAALMRTREGLQRNRLLAKATAERLRVLGGFDVALLWGNLGVSLLVVVAGAILVPALSLPSALVAIAVGCLIEGIPAMLILIPVLLPLATKLGLDPLHFGIILIFNLLIGIVIGAAGAAADAAEAGAVTAVCSGPQRRRRGGCPVMNGERCPLADEADAIVVLLDPNDAETERLVALHRQHRPGVPIFVTHGLSQSGEIPEGCIEISAHGADSVAQVLSTVGPATGSG